MADDNEVQRLSAALAEAEGALEPIRAIVQALEGKYGFPDDKPVDTRNMGDGVHNDFPGLTWGDMRRAASALATLQRVRGDQP